ELYRTAVGCLQVALNLDLLLGDASWLFEHAAANHFVSAGQWATVGDVYRRATREFAVADSFETVSSLLEPKTEASASNGSNGSGGDDAELDLSIAQLQCYVEPQPDLENFLGLVQLAVAADQEDVWVASASVAASLDIDALALTKLGRLVATTPDVCREGEFAPDYAEWTFLPSYNCTFSGASTRSMTFWSCRTRSCRARRVKARPQRRLAQPAPRSGWRRAGRCRTASSPF